MLQIEKFKKRLNLCPADIKYQYTLTSKLNKTYEKTITLTACVCMFKVLLINLKDIKTSRNITFITLPGNK